MVENISSLMGLRGENMKWAEPMVNSSVNRKGGGARPGAVRLEMVTFLVQFACKVGTQLFFFGSDRNRPPHPPPPGTHVYLGSHRVHPWWGLAAWREAARDLEPTRQDGQVREKNGSDREKVRFSIKDAVKDASSSSSSVHHHQG